MLGPYSSALTKAILSVIEKHKVPVIEANGAARELFAKATNIFSRCCRPQTNISPPANDLAAEHAADLGKTRAWA
jgi:branched-chain amino acid transport system substrate-binding protein